MNSFSMIVATALLAASTLATAQTPEWIADSRTGCKMANVIMRDGVTTSWSGACQNGVAQGRGVSQWFMDGKANGRYEGNVKDGKFNGHGVYTMEVGRYEGEWRDSKFHGRGVFTMTVGHRYEGEFKNGGYDGRGVLTYANGTKDNGEWRGSKLFNGRSTDVNGKVLAVYTDGSKAEPGAAPGASPPTARAAPSPTAVERITTSYDQRIAAARAQCTDSKDTCDKGCTGVATVGLLSVLAGKGKGANEASAQIEQCTKRCDDSKSSCDQQAKSLEQEKSQAIANAVAPPRPANVSSSGSATANTSGSGTAGTAGSGTATMSVSAAANILAARTCDRQCAMLVAETKCKNFTDAQESLSCHMQNGAARDDTPELCAQARTLTGCKTKQEKEIAAALKPFRGERRYASVCERNLKKTEFVMEDKKIAQAAATYDIFLKDINWYTAKLLEPCIGSSAESARLHKSAMDEYNRARQYCAGAHARHECTQWGASGGVSDNQGNPFNNPAWYAAWKAEVDKALSDPNYSADLGPVGSGAINAADAACATSLKIIENQFAAARRDIPANSVVVLSEASMWTAAASIAKIKAQCPQSEKYKPEAARLQSQYRDIKRACDASASRTCSPRLPGKEPAPVPQTVAAPLPPLQNKPPESCASSSGANFKACMQQACAKQQGTLTGSTCLTCDFPSGAWTRCPKGSGGVSSDQ